MTEAVVPARWGAAARKAIEAPRAAARAKADEAERKVLKLQQDQDTCSICYTSFVAVLRDSAGNELMGTENGDTSHRRHVMPCKHVVCLICFLTLEEQTPDQRCCPFCRGPLVDEAERTPRTPGPAEPAEEAEAAEARMRRALWEAGETDTEAPAPEESSSSPPVVVPAAPTPAPTPAEAEAAERRERAAAAAMRRRNLSFSPGLGGGGGGGGGGEVVLPPRAAAESNSRTQTDSEDQIEDDEDAAARDRSPVREAPGAARERRRAQRGQRRHRRRPVANSTGWQLAAANRGPPEPERSRTSAVLRAAAVAAAAAASSDRVRCPRPGCTTMTTARGLSTHLARGHAPVTCKQCGAGMEQAQLRAHLATPGVCRGVHSCPDCPYTATPELATTLVAAAAEAAAGRPAEASRLRYTCHACPAVIVCTYCRPMASVFTSGSDFTHHHITQHGDLPTVVLWCTQCHLGAFDSHAAFLRHRSVHIQASTAMSHSSAGAGAGAGAGAW